MASDDLIKVLVVDDSVIYRKIVGDAVSSIPDCQLQGTAPSGGLALRKLAQAPADLVFLDVFMPEMDGVETLRRIRQQFPAMAVVMISGATTRDAGVTIEALNLGALDFIPKPEGVGPEESSRLLVDAMKRVVRMVQLRRMTRRGGVPSAIVRPVAPPPAAPAPATQAMPVGSPTIQKPRMVPIYFDMVVIGVSTGGPNALAVVVPQLPADLGVPVLIVQHMPPNFTKALAEHLAKTARMPVREAVDNEPVLPNVILIAPGGRHMTLRASGADGKSFVVGINDSPPVNSCRPSVDVLFRSVAAVVNGGVLSVMLTGMGEDGAAGVVTLKRKNCYSLAQDERTCTVYGMPRAVVERGLADEVLSLDQMAPRMEELLRKRVVNRLKGS